MKFLLTEELGRLARWLRLMGHDAASATARPLTELYCRAYREGRTVLTRNRKIGASCLFRVVHVESPALKEQLTKVLRELSLSISFEQAFRRCDRCNVPVGQVDKSAIQGEVPPYVYETQDAFTRCPSCRRVYWAATHQRRISAALEALRR